MRIIIIEDERLTAEDLKQTLVSMDSNNEIIATIRSVEEGMDYLKNGEIPDLIFSDIRLGDGLSFEILDYFKVPVIFCTAYNEYALTAFQTNGIGYILKPFTTQTVKAALDKYTSLLHIKNDEMQQQYQMLKSMFSEAYKPKIASLLIRFRDTLFPLRIEDIAFFWLKNNVVQLTTFDNKNYTPGKTLDELENLVGDNFFRINRQYLINRSAIEHASSLLSRKLSISIKVPHEESLTISREKAAHFLQWLQEEH